MSRSWATTHLRGLLAWYWRNITRSGGATTFGVFYWLQVTNLDVFLNSAPNGPDHIDIFGLRLHALSPAELFLFSCGSGRGEKPSGENVLRLIQIQFVTGTRRWAK
jgi:hypothetical protein